jgi:magnesium chelatase family protein
MLSKIRSSGVYGIDGYAVEVETDISGGIPAFDIVGLVDTAVRESKERVRSAIRNSGLDFPSRRITVNLAPANVKKDGSAYDLPIALGILVSTGQISKGLDMGKYMFVGELSLDGEIKPVRGVLPMAVNALATGIESLVVPSANAVEAAVVKGLEVFAARNISEVVSHLNCEKRLEAVSINIDDLFKGNCEYDVDFSDVKGQENVKRALEVAASGGHNCLMVGSPGAGKTMLARRLPTILPPMTFEESLEVTKIHSIAGILPSNTPLVTIRPFRSPHHTISDIGLVGGGKYPKPGEICLSHYGVLFLDELPEFGRDALEVLRQPLEDGIVTISRASASFTYPAKTTLICAANPCKCGNHLDESKQCTCTPRQIKQYMGRLSKPLLDRIDIQVEVASVSYSELEAGKAEEKSRVIRERVTKARRIQLERYKGLRIYSNSQLSPSLTNRFCRVDEKGRELLRNAFERFGLSARAHNRILKVSRTIADMDGSEEIKTCHLAEAIQYRSLDRRL